LIESVRLVIWDLDDTFWKGTLTEGGIEVSREHCDIVVSLSRRGIISSICSKNDIAKVQPILEELAVWDYFILPSVNWEPKGSRIRSLIEAIQLRPATVLFVDDNPLNLHEAQALLPDLQVAGNDFIPQMLGDPRLTGKDDSGLTRLKQYRLLATRKVDEAAASENVEEFLRQSRIRVEIDYEVMSRLDRAIELITRTNQLNFTKLGLPAEPAEAVQSLKSLLAQYHVHAGLIKVSDRYGDHGYCGLYVTQYMYQHLVHFCFSCRILGMGVESWVYRQLGRPGLQVRGEVLVDIFNDSRDIDWINQEGGDEGGQRTEPFANLHVVRARGGCDLEALMHYFSPCVDRIIGEYATSRLSFQVRRDHTMFLRYALEGAVERVLPVYQLLGYEPEDLKTSLFTPLPDASLCLLSFIVEPTVGLYRHKASGVIVPFQFPGIRSDIDARAAAIEDLIEEVRTERTQQLLNALAREFEFEGVISRELFTENLKIILDAVPPDVRVVLMLSSETSVNRGEEHAWERGKFLNEWMREAAASYPFVSLFDMRAHVKDLSEMDGIFHFDRIVYYRVFRQLAAQYGS
jgi:FkbH-like protein